MATVVATEHLTAEEFLGLPKDGRLRELVRGKIVEMNLPGFRHGKCCWRIGHILGTYLDEHDCGHVTSNDAGVVTEREPDTVRGPDVAFYSYQRVPKGAEPEGYPDVPPELVFEVLSPEDRWPVVHRKIAEYLEGEVRAVCVLDPARRLVHVYEADHAGIVLTNDDELILPKILPDFRVAVQRFFG